MLVLPLSALGILAGHWLAYRTTGTPSGPYHEYLVHLPRVALVLLVLSFVAAFFVERGSRIALWPYPVVALSGFVVQEHLERLEYTGSLPFLLSSRVFQVGLAFQLIVALLVWLVARLLLVVVHADTTTRRQIAHWQAEVALGGALLPVVAPALGERSRAPPRGR